MTARPLTGLYMQDGRRPVAVPGAPGSATPSRSPSCASQLGEYFAGDRREFDLPLAPAGSEFQRRVWEALREIPYGETESYGELAERIGHPGSARAVGAANGRNPISIVVPCHRVIGASGSLTGYAGGLERKRAAARARDRLSRGGSAQPLAERVGQLHRDPGEVAVVADPLGDARSSPRRRPKARLPPRLTRCPPAAAISDIVSFGRASTFSGREVASLTARISSTVRRPGA